METEEEALDGDLGALSLSELWADAALLQRRIRETRESLDAQKTRLRSLDVVTLTKGLEKLLAILEMRLDNYKRELARR